MSTAEALLRRWEETRKSSVLEELGRVVSNVGLLRAATPTIRQAAARAAESEDTHDMSAARYLLQRLSSTGSVPPPYLDYIGWPLIAPLLPARASDGLDSAALQLLHQVAEELRDERLLFRLDEPGRAHLADIVTSFQARCRTLSAGLPVRAAPTDRALRVRLSALPESGLPEEIVFIRVLQATEVIFSSVATLLSEIVDHVRAGHLAPGIPRLYTALPLAGLVGHPLRFLVAMSVERWQTLRSFIQENSAIQESELHRLEVTLPLLWRLLRHPRIASHERDLAEVYTASLERLARSVRQWYRAHTRLASKYLACPGGYLSPGVNWLRQQDDTAVPLEVEGCTAALASRGPRESTG